MELHEVKIGDLVTFKKNGKMIKGKVLHRHTGETQPHLVGHVNVVADSDKSYPITIHVSKLKPALKEETQMENNTEKLSTSDLVNKIADGDNIGALEIFNAIMSERVSEIIDAHKVELGARMFKEEESDDDQEQEYGKCKECGEKMPEGKKGSYCCEECKEKAMMKKEDVELAEGGNAANKAKSRAYVKSLGTSPKSPQGWSNGHETNAEYDRRTVRAGREKLKNESVEQIDELSKKTMQSAYRARLQRDSESGSWADADTRHGDNFEKSYRTRDHLVKKYGKATRTPERKAGVHLPKNPDRHVLSKNDRKDMGESVEQIDELSKKTLSSYVNKSADNKAANAMMVGNVHGRIPNVSQRPDMSPRWKRIEKRTKGIATAVSKLTKEEVEQIDELSKSTMGSYVDKAKKSQTKHQTKSDSYYDKAQSGGGKYKRISGSNDDARDYEHNMDKGAEHHKKSLKRLKGIKTATTKLTKEAVIEPKSGVKSNIPAEAAAKAKEDMEKHKAKKAALLAAAKKELETSKIPVKLFAPKKED